jgi:hypothetical protein
MSTVFAIVSVVRRIAAHRRHHVPFETDYSVNQLTLLAGNTAGHALTGGHKQALRHAPETPLSSERVQYRAPCRCAPRSYADTHTSTHTHTRERQGRPPRHISDVTRCKVSSKNPERVRSKGRIVGSN